MGATPQLLRPLVLQAADLIEGFHTRSSARRSATRSRWLPPAPAVITTPSWLKPNANCDLAARVASGLALRTNSRVGYLAVGECAIHAVARMWLLVAGIKASSVATGKLAKDDFPRLTRAAGRIACSQLTFSDQDVPKKKIQQATRKFIEDSQLEFLVVDDPDVETLRNPKLLPEQEHWRIRMEFREAVRGTNVMMILPG